jgi:hypothetical protein
MTSTGAIVGLAVRGLAGGMGGLGAVMRCGRVRVAVRRISLPGSECERRGFFAAGTSVRTVLRVPSSTARLTGLHRGAQARPSPFGRWCFTRSSLALQRMQQGYFETCDGISSPLFPSGAPTHSDTHITGASISAMVHLYNVVHHVALPPRTLLGTGRRNRKGGRCGGRRRGEEGKGGWIDSRVHGLSIGASVVG